MATVNSLTLRKVCSIFILLLLPLIFSAQVLKGKITDAGTKLPVPFAVVIIDSTNTGTTADLDGNFEVNVPVTSRFITVQVIGYVKKISFLSELDFTKINNIPLQSSGFSLSEIIIKPGENPANAIIKQVISNKPAFDIDNLPAYICSTYEKTYFTLSDKKGDENLNPSDTIASKILANAYLFFMESVTEKKYHYKNIRQEKIIASKVSGFKNAPFGAFASQLQSFTFYRNKIELLGLNYVNPLIKGTFKRYSFEITDTVLNNLDTTILIKFTPKKNARFTALKGILYINKNQCVLANVIAEPAEVKTDGTGIKIQQLYERVDSIHWFPKQLNTEILFYGLGQSSGTPGATIKGVSKVYIKEVKLDSTFRIRNQNVSAFNEPGFDKNSDSFWSKQRVDSLTRKEIKTYRVIDSLGKREKFDEKLKLAAALGSGQISVGYFNMDINRFLRFNNYEGLRLGAGISTGNKLSRWFSIGGYGGYGFSDKAWKYGGFGRVNLNHRQSAYLMTEASHEVVETAGTFFLQEKANFLSTESLRNILVSKMDKVGLAKISVNGSLFKFIHCSAYFQVQERESPSGYIDASSNLPDESTKFIFNETGLQFKIWPKEKFTESMGTFVSSGSKWPVIFINVAKGFTSDVAGYKGDFDYLKFDLRIDHQVYFKVKGFISYQLQAGKVFGNVPYTLQYNNKGSRSNRYLVTAEKSFETMYLNEFISSEYAALFFAVNSGKILRINKYFNPEIELVHNYGIGTLKNSQNLTQIPLNDIHRGFAEAGLRIKCIVKSQFTTLGIGAYYRYGSYANVDETKNLVAKLVIGYSF